MCPCIFPSITSQNILRQFLSIMTLTAFDWMQFPRLQVKALEDQQSSLSQKDSIHSAGLEIFPRRTVFILHVKKSFLEGQYSFCTSRNSPNCRYLISGLPISNRFVVTPRKIYSIIYFVWSYYTHGSMHKRNLPHWT
jgi:hypothetical protein